jgi:hypothetical protein
MTFIIYPLIVLIATIVSSGSLYIAGKITRCEGELVGFTIVSFISVIISLLIPIPFINAIANLFLLKKVTRQDIFPHVILLVIVASVFQSGSMVYLTSALL